MRMMTGIIHKIVGYDLETDRLAVSYPVPEALLAEMKALACVGPKDPEAVFGAYPLTQENARRATGILGQPYREGLEFFLEPFAAATAPDRGYARGKIEHV